MLKKIARKIGQAVLLVLVSLLVVQSVPAVQSNSLADSYILTPRERFGIAAPYSYSAEDLSFLNVHAVLDWSMDNAIPLPEDIEYVHVLRVSDSLYASAYASLETLVANNPGEVWIIGNEPDRLCVQDSINPEVYGERFFAMATRIRTLDPSAQTGFGSVVQPTPIRIRYLQRALDRLIALSGGDEEEAMGLIDIWSIHNFILNENPLWGVWGAGVPVGFYTYNLGDLPSACYTGDVYSNDTFDRVEITDFSDTYSITIFRERVVAFRTWLNEIGEKEKPLWITEYGSLFPPIDPPGGPNYVNVSDEDTSAFMLDSFDFMLNEEDAAIGYSQDANHLVQRWFWYSLNDHRYTFGGSLLDPDAGLNLTLVGERFKQYTDLLPRFFYFITPVRR
jgi:hypothetical protein